MEEFILLAQKEKKFQLTKLKLIENFLLVSIKLKITKSH